jgi:capsular polysaccharide export protein
MAGRSIKNGKIRLEKTERVFLFLQGHPSAFTRKLADELERLGHTALKINFCAGDALYWFGRKAFSYRGKFENWPDYLRSFVLHEGVSDILYYGDRGPYHVVAAQIARELGIKSFAFEFGYLRPDWITIERGGMSAYSHFPNDPEIIKAIGRQFAKPDLDSRYHYGKATEIFHEVTYNLTSFFLSFAYPFYKSGHYYNPLLEYISGIPGLFLEARNKRRAQDIIDTILHRKHPYFLFPLQLQSDSQLVYNADFEHQKEAIDLVLRSFAKHANEEDHLIFKQHPLDNGWEGWKGMVEKLSRRHGISERTHFIIGGNLHLLLNRARGCVLINSTVGISALHLGCPVKVLGIAVYDIAGLCHKGSLDNFWQDPSIPDKKLIDAFERALGGTIQVKGNFFTEKGQKAAISAMAPLLLENRVNGSGAYVDPPPRLEQTEL